MTIAVIDGLVHHATILEMNGANFRRFTEPVAAATTSVDNIGIAATDNINDKFREACVDWHQRTQRPKPAILVIGYGEGG